IEAAVPVEAGGGDVAKPIGRVRGLRRQMRRSEHFKMRDDGGDAAERQPRIFVADHDGCGGGLLLLVHRRTMTRYTAPRLYTPDRLQAHARMDLALRQNRRLRPEALDDRADEGAGGGAGEEHRGFALARGFLKAVAHGDDEIGELRRL